MLQNNSSRLVNLFLEVARINALSGSEKTLADFIKSFLSKYNYTVHEDEAAKFTNSNTGNLICKIGTGGDFILTSHMDTARPTENLKPIVKEDRIV